MELIQTGLDIDVAGIVRTHSPIERFATLLLNALYIHSAWRNSIQCCPCSDYIEQCNQCN